MGYYSVVTINDKLLYLQIKFRKVGDICGALKNKTSESGVAKSGTNALKQIVVHGNSLLSAKPTWGYKLFNIDGTFLKNRITNKLIPEGRYTKAFMSDKYMEAIPFQTRLPAYQWEFQQNLILKGPLNLNMH